MIEDVQVKTDLTRAIMKAIERGFTVEDFKKLLDTRVKLQTLLLRGGKKHPQKKKKKGDCS
jgi:hypothetical protein